MHHLIIMLMISVSCLSHTQGQTIHPAKIYVDQIKGKLEFTCSTYGLRKMEKSFYIYLCKDGIGIDMKSSCQDAEFSVATNTKENTGNYSCVFSEYKYKVEEVREVKGINSVFITVTNSFIPAELILPESSVQPGTDVEFQCTSLKLPEKNQKSNIYAYLYKNGTVIQMIIWNIMKNKTRFILKEVTKKDSGTYICFLMSEPNPLPKTVHGTNEVNLHVTGDPMEIFPARIFGSSTAKVGENVLLKCRISNLTSSVKEVHMYLCKNGVGERLELLENKDEHTFTLKNVSLRDTGSYSCVYSFGKHLPTSIAGAEMNSIFVQVTDESTITVDETIQSTDYVKYALLSLGTLLLVVVIYKLYRYTMICHKSCQNQGHSTEPVNMSNNEGLSQVNQTENRNEASNDMGEYATIDEEGGTRASLTAFNAECNVFYSQAGPCEMYSLLQHHEDKPNMQRETEQSRATAVYAKVMKEMKK